MKKKYLKYWVIVSSTYLKKQIRTFETAIIITPWVKLPLNQWHKATAVQAGRDPRFPLYSQWKQKFWKPWPDRSCAGLLKCARRAQPLSLQRFAAIQFLRFFSESGSPHLLNDKVSFYSFSNYLAYFEFLRINFFNGQCWLTANHTKHSGQRVQVCLQFWG